MALAGAETATVTAKLCTETEIYPNYHEPHRYTINLEIFCNFMRRRNIGGTDHKI